MISMESVRFPDWLHFKGTAEDEGETYLLRAQDGHGAIRMPKEHVAIHEGIVSVRNNSPASIVERPKRRVLVGVLASEVSTQGCVRQDDCPTKCCACIGLVRVCCNTGG